VQLICRYQARVSKNVIYAGQYMKIILTHATGNQNVRAVLSSLYKEEMLAGFNTAIAVQENNGLLHLLPASMTTEIRRRSFPVPRKLIHTKLVRELARLALPKLGFKKHIQHEKGWACIDAVFRELDRYTASRLSNCSSWQNSKRRAVYSYEDGALETFKAAKKMDISCIYELPIAYWETGKKLLKEESERVPAWAETLGGGIKDSAEKLERKTEELQLADIVIAPSSFVLDSLPLWAAEKNRISAAFGSPATDFSAKNGHPVTENKKRPLRVLFVGSMSQRKGLADLFSAVRLLNCNNIELIIMGSLQAPMEFYKKQLNNFTYLPGRPHEEVLQLMRSCDVFCLPSIVEGRALVMQEAMSQGLPLIITANTGGQDLIIEGVTGFLVPIRSPESIAEKLTWFLEHRETIPAMAVQARLHAARYTWNGYGKNIINGIKAAVEPV
jgi:glycosyltransferase involved in cell wall biosynthesis